MKGQPDPSDMLEELADKAISHIARLAVTSFESAIAEMVDFHQFLIAAYATKDESGRPVSYAQAGDWQALHKEWIRQYRRVFERAVENIGRENDFVDELVHLPQRLLPSDARNAAPEVIAGLLDLPNIYVHRLERWLTQRRSFESTEVGQPRAVRLAGTDKQAYEEVLSGFVGAWESLLQTVSYLYEWRQREVDLEEQWHRYATSAPFLQQHIRNSAYLLAVAVWNEDDIGADFYREILLRWLDGLRHELDEYDHHPRRLLTVELLESKWKVALDVLAKSSENPEWDQPTPTSIVASILQNQQSDVIAIASGVILAWFIEHRQTTDIAPRIVSLLLRDTVDEDGGHRTARETGFRAFFLCIIRIWVSGDRFERKGYGHWLDDLVSLLDAMTERRVVPGRVYSPSTRNKRDALRLPWLACLLASLPPEGDDGAVDSIRKLTDREDAFMFGDQSLRDLLYELRQSKAALEASDKEYLRRGALALDRNQDVENGIGRLANIFGRAIDAIESRRAERLKDRPVNFAKLNRVREQIEEAILSGNGGIEVFRGFEIARDGTDLAKIELSATSIEKGYLTEPPMTQEPVNLWDVVLRTVQNRAVRNVWQDFARRPRRTVATQDEASYRSALFDEASRLAEKGQQPVLLVSRGKEPTWIRRWFGWGEELPEGIKVIRKKGMGASLYAGTLNDIDVFRLELDPGRSLLFRSDLLQKVKYSSDNHGHIVNIEFDEDRGKGLLFRFFQGTEWLDEEVVELVYPVAAES